MPDLTYIHPMIVHFPIALLIIGFLSDVVGLLLKRQFFTWVGFYLLMLGTVGLIAAYVTGTIAGDGLSEEGPLKQVLDSHQGAAQLTLLIVVLAALVRLVTFLTKSFSGTWRWVALGIYFIGVAAVARTGYYGGELVFRHAAGVQLMATPDAETSLQNDNPSTTTSDNR